MSRTRRARRAAAREQKREVPALPARRPRLDFALLGLLGVLLGVSVYRFVMMSGSPGPPGSDPGNWLAFTHELFGDSAKAADSTYFPVTLVLLKGLLGFLPELAVLVYKRPVISWPFVPSEDAVFLEAHLGNVVRVGLLQHHLPFAGQSGGVACIS